MNKSYWALLVLVATTISNGNCRPREVDVKNIYSVYRSEKQLDRTNSSPLPTTVAEVKSETKNSSQSESKFNIESIATVARATNNEPPLLPAATLGHMLDTVSELVESDIRTPPKLKEIIKEKANEHKKEILNNSSPLPYTFVYEDEIRKFEEKHEPTDTILQVYSSEGKASNIHEGVKGIAIPVILHDDYELSSSPKKLQKVPEVPKPAKEDKKKTSVTKSQLTTTPSSGLSTWILLNDNRDVTTPSPKKNNSREEDDKKKAGVTITVKKPDKTQSTTQKVTTLAIKKVTAKPTSKKPERDTMSALEAMVKNQKKNNATTSTPKITETKKKVPGRLEVAETKDKVEIELPEYKIQTLPSMFPLADNKSVTAASSQSSTKSTTESLVSGTTKKKSTTKKKKKNKNKKKKPADDTGVQAKIPVQPVGSQIYNFLSREIVPTVGLGLIGVALTAGLASFLGYNPFGSTTLPLRRTYETHHGYTPNYFSYNTDYGDGGQSEEVLFREVLSGMPEESRYGLTHSDTTYPEISNRQDQIYDSVTVDLVYPSVTGTMYNSDKSVGSYDVTYPQDYSTEYGSSYDPQGKKYSADLKEYPVYTEETGTSFVYPELSGITADKKSNDYATQTNTPEKYAKTNPDKIERQPEALYRVASESELQYGNKKSTIQGVSSQSNWHRIGSPMKTNKQNPMLEPGPRSLDLNKGSVKKRSRRTVESVIQRISPKRMKKANDIENEIDSEDSFKNKFSEENFENGISTTTTTKTTITEYPKSTKAEFSTTISVPSTTEEVKEASPTESTDNYDVDNDGIGPPSTGLSILDVLKRLAQFKLRLGLNFLRSTTDIVSRYLDDIQRRVDESFANTTTTVQYNREKSPWSRIFFSRLNNDNDNSYRRKRSVLEDAMFKEESVRFSKSTKKDLKLSNKMFHQKKNFVMKFEQKRTI